MEDKEVVRGDEQEAEEEEEEFGRRKTEREHE